MRISYEVSKAAFVSVLLFLAGIFCIVKGGGAIYRGHHASALSELYGTALQEGSYAAGEIETCLVKELKSAGAGKYSGECNILFDGGREYRFYTIPIAGGRYIQIMAYHKETKSALQNLIKGEDISVPFVGILIRPPLKGSLQWYEDIPGFQPESLVQDYVLKEVDLNSQRNLLIIGGILLFTAFLLYAQSGGIRKRVLEPERFDRIERLYTSSYNKENELELERDRMRLLRKREAALKYWCVAGVGCLFLGIYAVVAAQFFEGKLAGILLVLFSLKKIWKWFIHSGLTVVVKIAHTFEKRTLQDDIEDCELRIAVLEDLLRKDIDDKE